MLLGLSWKVDSKSGDQETTICTAHKDLLQRSLNYVLTHINTVRAVVPYVLKLHLNISLSFMFSCIKYSTASVV